MKLISERLIGLRKMEQLSSKLSLVSIVEQVRIEIHIEETKIFVRDIVRQRKKLIGK